MCSAPTKKFSGKNHTGNSNAAPYPVSRLAPATELVDLAQAIADADKTIQSHVSGKLTVIAEQIKGLQNQARQILEQAQRDQNLHRASCQCQRIIGHIYYLYEKENQSCYFSMLSPNDWHDDPPHQFVGAYRLEHDMSWTTITDENASQDNAIKEQLQELFRLSS
jgi:hypothetical protein